MPRFDNWTLYQSIPYWEQQRKEQHEAYNILVDAELNLNPIFHLRWIELKQTKFSKRKQAKILRDVFGLQFVREYSI